MALPRRRSRRRSIRRSLLIRIPLRFQSKLSSILPLLRLPLILILSLISISTWIRFQFEVRIQIGIEWHRVESRWETSIPRSSRREWHSEFYWHWIEPMNRPDKEVGGLPILFSIGLFDSTFNTTFNSTPIIIEYHDHHDHHNFRSTTFDWQSSMQNEVTRWR